VARTALRVTTVQAALVTLSADLLYCRKCPASRQFLQSLTESPLIERFPAPRRDRLQGSRAAQFHYGPIARRRLKAEPSHRPRHDRARHQTRHQVQSRRRVRGSPPIHGRSRIRRLFKQGATNTSLRSAALPDSWPGRQGGAGAAHGGGSRLRRHSRARRPCGGEKASRADEPINPRDRPDYFHPPAEHAADIIAKGAPNVRLQFDFYHAQGSSPEI